MIKKLLILTLILTCAPLCFAQTQRDIDKKAQAAKNYLLKADKSALFENQNKDEGQWFFKSKGEVEKYIKQNKTEMGLMQFAQKLSQIYASNDIVLLGESHSQMAPTHSAFYTVLIYNDSASQDKKITHVFYEMSEGEATPVLDRITAAVSLRQDRTQRLAACRQGATTVPTSEGNKTLLAVLCLLKTEGINVRFIDLDSKLKKEINPALCESHNSCIIGTDVSSVETQGQNLRNANMALQLGTVLKSNSRAVFAGGAAHIAPIQKMLKKDFAGKNITSILQFSKAKVISTTRCQGCNEEHKMHLITPLINKIYDSYSMDKIYIVPFVAAENAKKDAYKNIPADFLVMFPSNVK